MGRRSPSLVFLLVLAVMAAPLQAAWSTAHVHSDRARQQHDAGHVHTHVHSHGGTIHIHTHYHHHHDDVEVDDDCDGHFEDHDGDITEAPVDGQSQWTSSRRIELETPNTPIGVLALTTPACSAISAACLAVPPPELRGHGPRQLAIRTTVLRL